MPKVQLKQEVRNFYDEVGWREVSQGVYQNALYEDLRPVCRNYIHRCHLRINRHLGKSGKYLLDAGSGPIQYEEYLTYSAGYQYRVCLDISIVALMDARKKISKHGLFVVGDIARLPFRNDIFSDLISLHTIHHLPRNEYSMAYKDIRRVLVRGGKAVIVNGWDSSPLMNLFYYPIAVMERLFSEKGKADEDSIENDKRSKTRPEGTFVHKLDAKGLRRLLGDDFPIQILVWRSVSVRFLRAMIHPFLMGKFLLGILYLKEELFPRFLGEKGQYPLIIFSK